MTNDFLTIIMILWFYNITDFDPISCRTGRHVTTSINISSTLMYLLESICLDVDVLAPHSGGSG